MDIITLIATLIILPLFIAYLTMLNDRETSNTDREAYLTEKIDSLLPQTQCGECHYEGCLPYANAIATGNADINQCPPGGEVTIKLIAELLGRDPKPLNPVYGTQKNPEVALIDEQKCIGCVLCIKACPVDAIIGAPKQMHTVMPKVCTGCELCIEPCPVDCISMIPAETKIKKFVWSKPQQLLLEDEA